MEAVAITRSIVVAADRERVWRAITTPEQIAQWFEPIRFERLAVRSRRADGSLWVPLANRAAPSGADPGDLCVGNGS